MPSRPDAEVSELYPTVQQEIAKLAAAPEVRSAFTWFRAQEPQFAQWQLELARIAAPPFGEAARSVWLAEKFQQFGLDAVQTDEVGNVFGTHSGYGHGYVALSAHLDTVFPAGTPLNVRQQGSRLYGPGVSDNGAGVTAILAVAAMLQAVRLRHALPLLFIGNVGEEGEGDLRGMRHIFSTPRWKDSIHTALSSMEQVLTRLSPKLSVAAALKLSSAAQGDIPGAILARPIQLLCWHGRSGFCRNPSSHIAKDHIQCRCDSRRNFGKFHSRICQHAGRYSFHIDGGDGTPGAGMRYALDQAVEQESRAHEAQSISQRRPFGLSHELVAIGNRPAGELHPSAHIMQVIRAVDAQLGNAAQVQRASTDANIPLSLGREAIAIGGGGAGGGAHTLQEWFDCSGRELGLKRILLILLGLAGRGR